MSFASASLQLIWSLCIQALRAILQKLLPALMVSCRSNTP